MPAASLLAGPPGFIASPDPRRLDIAAHPIPGDPLLDALKPGAPVGLLGIELWTRRRNRMNGRVIAADARGFSVAVDQSFGNCPQYIQRRDYLLRRELAAPRVEAFAALDEGARRADRRGRHLLRRLRRAGKRGGGERGRRRLASRRPPGFVAIESDGSLLVPDFSGNRFFNTLGNLMANPKAGLLFPDFETGDLLQIGGSDGDYFRGSAAGALPRRRAALAPQALRRKMAPRGVAAARQAARVLAPVAAHGELARGLGGTEPPRSATG